MINDPDADLIEGLKSGDSKAQFSFFNRHADALRRHIFYVHARSLSDADDILLKSFEKVFRDVPKFRGKSKLTTWLFKIVKNTSIDFYRSSANRYSSNDPEAHESFDANTHNKNSNDPSTKPSEEHQDKITKAFKYFHKLSEAEKSVITLRRIEELSIRETATKMKKSEAAVKMLSARAIKKLREFMINDSAVDGNSSEKREAQNG